MEEAEIFWLSVPVMDMLDLCFCKFLTLGWESYSQGDLNLLGNSHGINTVDRQIERQVGRQKEYKLAGG